MPTTFTDNIQPPFRAIAFYHRGWHSQFKVRSYLISGLTRTMLPARTSEVPSSDLSSCCFSMVSYQVVGDPWHQSGMFLCGQLLLSGYIKTLETVAMWSHNSDPYSLISWSLYAWTNAVAAMWLPDAITVNQSIWWSARWVFARERHSNNPQLSTKTKRCKIIYSSNKERRYLKSLYGQWNCIYHIFCT